MGVAGLSPSIYSTPLGTLQSLGWETDWAANEGATIVDGKVSQLVDAISGIALTQSDAAKRFLLVTNAIDSLPVLRPADGNTLLANTGISFSPPLSFFAALKVNGLGVTVDRDIIWSVPNNSALQLYSRGSSIGYWGGGATAEVSNSVAVNGLYIIVLRLLSDSLTFNVNGSPSIQRSAGTNSVTGGIALGGQNSIQNRCYDADYVRFGYARKSMTDQELNQTAALIRQSRPSLPWTNL